MVEDVVDPGEEDLLLLVIFIDCNLLEVSLPPLEIDLLPEPLLPPAVDLPS